MTDFADHPQSVTEIRSDLDNDFRAWTPRDVLVAMLRDIDSGKKDPDALVVVWRPRGCDSAGTTISAPHMLTALGLLTRAAFQVQMQQED